MSNFIKTKNPSQCRSHHQKFYRKEGSESGSNSNHSNNSPNSNDMRESLILNNLMNEKNLLKMEELTLEQNNNNGLRKNRKSNKRIMEEEKNENDEDILNVNKLNEKELEDFICSAKMLFSVGGQMGKLRKNFEDFETKNLKIFKESCNFSFQKKGKFIYFLVENLDFYNYYTNTQHGKPIKIEESQN